MGPRCRGVFLVFCGLSHPEAVRIVDHLPSPVLILYAERGGVPDRRGEHTGVSSGSLAVDGPDRVSDSEEIRGATAVWGSKGGVVFGGAPVLGNREKVLWVPLVVRGEAMWWASLGRPEGARLPAGCEGDAWRAPLGRPGGAHLPEVLMTMGKRPPRVCRPGG